MTINEEYIPQKLTRTSSPALDDILGVPFKVLDHGFIRVIDYMGDGGAVAQMARVSYGKGTKTVNEDRGLLRYLMRNRHSSPFEGDEIKLHIKLPIFVMRQWIRHRTANVNEYSMRYSEPKDEFYCPELENIQLQATDNKQGRSGEMELEYKEEFQRVTSMTAERAKTAYNQHKAMGVARELNRMNLPLTAYTEAYWKIDLHNLLHFLSLRADPHAQYEIRVYAEVILEQIVKVWVPDIYEAFIDYVMEAETFSRQEMDIIKKVMYMAVTQSKFVPHIKEELTENGVSKREIAEFLTKIGVPNDDSN